MSRSTPEFSSRIAPVFARYVALKQALGRDFKNPARTLQLLDQFLHERADTYPELNAAAFQDWCHTHEHVSSGVRRFRMMEVYNFCLYRRRSEPQCFVPDPKLFPKPHQKLQPYIFSEQDVARLLEAASKLKRLQYSPLRPEVIRLAIVLLFTTGVRRRELLHLTAGDYDRRNATLLIRESKFHKSRLLPLNSDIVDELELFLNTRKLKGFSVSADTALIWNATNGGRAYSYQNLRCCMRSVFRQCSIFSARGRLPRIHDLRHSFAVNVLLRWYREGAEVEAKLPLLTTYMGHASVMSTHYYLHWVEPLRTAASERFAGHYGALVMPMPELEGACR
jgi:integrase/recombinase XerD